VARTIEVPAIHKPGDRASETPKAGTTNRAKLCHAAWMVVIAIGFVYSADAPAQGVDRGGLDRDNPDPDASAGERRCASTFFVCPGCDTSTKISVQTGRGCTIRYRSRGGIFSQKVMVRPRGGVYGTADVSYGAYKPNPGFVGSDSFQVDIEYERSGQRTVTHLKATVNVRP